VITSYALLRRDIERYEANAFSVAVLDEAQHIKNRSTQNAVAVKQIRAHHKVVLTGTPVENGVADIWSIMDFLMPGYLGEYELFRGEYEQPIAAGDRDGEIAQDQAAAQATPLPAAPPEARRGQGSARETDQDFVLRAHTGPAARLQRPAAGVAPARGRPRGRQGGSNAATWRSWRS